MINKNDVMLSYRLFFWLHDVQKWAWRRLTGSGLMVAIVLVVSSNFIFDTNRLLTYQIFAFLGPILIISIISSYFFAFHFSAVRTLPRFATVGVKLQYRVVIYNKTSKVQRGLKLWENFADNRPSFSEFIEMLKAGEKKQNMIQGSKKYYQWLWRIARKQWAVSEAVELPPLSPRSKIEVIVTIDPYCRGVIRLTGLTITRPDPFGLFNACKTFSLPQYLWILPERYALPSILLPGARKYQSGGVALASSVGDSEEFTSLRDYRPGDPLRKIHWKSWAKTGKPIVREEQDEFFVRHALVLDTFQQQLDSDLLEEALSVAASFACEVQTQESLLDLMFVGTQAYCFTSGRGVGYTEQMLEIIATVKACHHADFEELTALVISRASLLSGCICIFLSWDGARQKLVNYLKALEIPLLVLLIVENDSQANGFEGESMNAPSAQFKLLKLGQIQEGLMPLRS